MQRGPLARPPSSGKLTVKVIHRLSDSIEKSSLWVCITSYDKRHPFRMPFYWVPPAYNRFLRCHIWKHDTYETYRAIGLLLLLCIAVTVRLMQLLYTRSVYKGKRHTSWRFLMTFTIAHSNSFPKTLFPISFALSTPSDSLPHRFFLYQAHKLAL